MGSKRGAVRAHLPVAPERQLPVGPHPVARREQLRHRRQLLQLLLLLLVGRGGVGRGVLLRVLRGVPGRQQRQTGAALPGAAQRRVKSLRFAGGGGGVGRAGITRRKLTTQPRRRSSMHGADSPVRAEAGKSGPDTAGGLQRPSRDGAPSARACRGAARPQHTHLRRGVQRAVGRRQQRQRAGGGGGHRGGGGGGPGQLLPRRLAQQPRAAAAGAARAQQRTPGDGGAGGGVGGAGTMAGGGVGRRGGESAARGVCGGGGGGNGDKNAKFGPSQASLPPWDRARLAKERAKRNVLQSQRLLRLLLDEPCDAKWPGGARERSVTHLR